MNYQKDTCIYKTVNDHPIKADIYLINKSNSPVILLIHGGALINGSRETNIPQDRIELYNNADFNVIAIDYRLAPETKLKYIIDDIKDSINWIDKTGREKYGFDSDKLGVVGSSAGAYLSLMSGTFDRKPKAIVSFYGYGDIITDWYCKPSEFYCKEPLVTMEEAYKCVGDKTISTGNSDRSKFYLYCRQNGIWTSEVSCLDIISDKKELMEYCPIYKIGKQYPPTLLLHGDEDTDVPYVQSVDMARELDKQCIENKLITIKGKGHDFDGDKNNDIVKKALDEVIEFLWHHVC